MSLYDKMPIQQQAHTTHNLLQIQKATTHHSVTKRDIMIIKSNRRTIYLLDYLFKLEFRYKKKTFVYCIHIKLSSNEILSTSLIQRLCIKYYKHTPSTIYQ